MSYSVKHIGCGNFELTLDETGEIKQCGKNIVGMIRYTYFEDFSLPSVGWEVYRIKLLEDYMSKVSKDILDGNIKPGYHDFGTTDWIEKI
jgi:alpha-tubulin suppressor-like RCC1 family protein